MWIVIKYKVLQFNLFKNSLKNLLKEEPNFYFPKIRTTRIQRKYKIFRKIFAK